MARPTRQDTYRLSVVIDGASAGIWENLTGGAGDSEETKHRLGGMGPQVSLGGSQTVENATLAKLLDGDEHQAVKNWFNRRGRAPVTVTKQPLDIDANVYGPPIVYTGLLKGVSPPEVDAQGSDAGMVSIEVSTNGTIG